MEQGEAQERPTRAGTRAVWLLFAVLTLNIVDRQVVNILAHPISEELGLSDTQLGLLTGLAFAVFYNLAGIPIGRWSDRPATNRSRLLAGALACWSTATAACAAATSFSHLLIARVLVAASESGCVPPGHSLIADLVPATRRGRALAIFGLGVPAGALIGKAGGGVLTQAYGWRAAFLIVGLPGLVLAAIFVVAVREPRRGASLAGPPRLPFGEVLRLVRRSPALLYMTMGTASAMLLVTGGSVWGMIHFLRNHHLDTATAGVWLGLSGGLAGVAGTWLGGWAADRYGRRNPRHLMLPATVAMLASVPLLFLAWYARDWRIALVLLFLPDLFDNVYYGGTFSALQALMPAEARATVTACFLFVVTLLGTGLGALGFGVASDWLRPVAGGSESVRWVLMGASLLYVVPAFCYWRAGISLARELPAGVD